VNIFVKQVSRGQIYLDYAIASKCLTFVNIFVKQVSRGQIYLDYAIARTISFSECRTNPICSAERRDSLIKF